MKIFALVSTMALTLIMAGGTHAQITIQQSSLDGIGYTSSTSSSVGTATVNTGAAGANQTWTFGMFTWEFTSPYNIVDPTTLPYHDQFPTANRGVIGYGTTGTGASVVTFERAASNGLFMLGWETDTATVFDQPQMLAPLPLTYQTNWSSVMRYHNTPYPGYDFVYADSSTNAVDGWGTLNTPYGSYACLRLFSHHYISTGLSGYPPETYENVSYAWVNQHGEVILSISSPQGDTNPNFTLGSVEMMGAPLAANPAREPVATTFSLGQNYPNPFNPTTMLPMDIARAGHVTLNIYDEIGRLVLSEPMDLPVGHHDVAIDGSRWASGLYFARVKADGAEHIVKMQLLK